MAMGEKLNLVEVERIHKDKERLEELKIRTKNCCCRYCGGKLSLRRIVYGVTNNGRVEIFCDECDRIEYGTNQEIYEIAKYYVDEFEFNHYPDNDDSLKTYQMNVAKICDIISWGCKNLDILDYDGFKVPINITDTIMGEEVIIYKADLDAEVEIRDMDEDAIFGRQTGVESCL